MHFFYLSLPVLFYLFELISITQPCNPCSKYCCTAACCLGLMQYDCWSYWAVPTERCPPNAPICHLTTGECRKCDFWGTSGCPPGLACNAASGLCTGCVNSTQCPSGTACISGTCISGCTSDNDCNSTYPSCNITSGKCFHCATSGCTPTKPTCDTGTGLCSPCTLGTNLGCVYTSSTPLCSSAGNCVACQTSNNAPCSGNTPRCDPVSGKCLACNANNTSPCTSVTPLCTATGACASCDSSTHLPCLTLTNTPMCDSAVGCVACTSSTNSPCNLLSPRIICHASSGSCVACDPITYSPCVSTSTTPLCNPNLGCEKCNLTTNQPCSGSTPYCNSDGSCGPCPASNLAPCIGTKPLCFAGACTPCDVPTNNPCGGSTPKCLSTGNCTQCDSSFCKSPNPICLPIGCRSCTSVGCSAPNPYCNQTSGSCYNCSSISCPTDYPVCNTTTGNCSLCVASNTPPCVGTTPLCAMNGSCVACTLNTNSPCIGLTPKCNLDGSCGPCTANNTAPCNVSKPLCLPTGNCSACNFVNQAPCWETITTPMCSAAGSCLKCMTTTNFPCSPFSTTPLCSTNGSCTACNSTHPCTLTKPKCLPDGSCGPCSGNNTYPCTQNKPYCVGNGSCIACNIITHEPCRETNSTPQCTSTGACSACDPVTHFPCFTLPIYYFTPLCTTSGCLPCNATDPCRSPKPFCNLTSGNCYSCLTTSCSGSTPRCNETSGYCEPCNSTSCITSPKLYCNTTTGTCQNCSEYGCSSPSPYCDPVSGLCLSCSQTGCLPPSGTCNLTSGLCFSCMSKGCSHLLPEFYCQTSTGNCTNKCNFTSDCKNNYSCSANFMCVQCINDTNCSTNSSGRQCIGNLCRPCSSNLECLSAKKYCISGICSECVNNSNCTNPNKPICDLSNHTCRACNNETECISPYFCNSFSGSCDQCLLSNCLKCQTLTNCILCASGYKVSGGLCVAVAQTQAPVAEITQTKSNPNIFLISFSNPVTITAQDLEKQLLIVFSKPSANTTITLIKADNMTFYLEIHHNSFIVSQTINITFTDPSQIRTIDGFYLTKKQYKLNINGLISSDLIRTVSQIKNLVSNPGVITGGFFLVSMNPSVIWLLIGLIQNFYYLLFINSRYPYNIEMLLSLFSVAKLDFLPNIFLHLNLNTKDFELQTPSRFEAQGLGGLFLIHGGPLLTVLIFGWIMYYFSHYFWRFTRNVPKIIMFPIVYYVNSFKWELAIQLMISCYMQLCLTSVLQISVMDDKYWIQVLSAYLGNAVYFLCLFLPFILIKVVSKLKHGYKPNQKIYRPLVKDLKNVYTPGHHLIAVELIRRFITANSLVGFYQYPMLQILFYALSNFGYLLYYIKYRPKKKKIENFFDLISQINYMVVLILVTVLIGDNEDPDSDHKVVIGWAVIGLCFGDILFQLLSSVARKAPENIKAIIKWLKPKPIETKEQRAKRRARRNRKKLSKLENKDAKFS